MVDEVADMKIEILLSPKPPNVAVGSSVWFGETQRWKSLEMKSVQFTVGELRTGNSFLLGLRDAPISERRNRERQLRFNPPIRIAILLWNISDISFFWDALALGTSITSLSKLRFRFAERQR